MDSLYSKIRIRYNIINPPKIIYPRDSLSGKIILENFGENQKKLKKVYIRLISRYEHYERIESSTSFIGSRHKWMHHKESLKKYPLDHPKIINPGEKLEIDFNIQLPPKWKPKIGRRLRNWHLTLDIFHKSGLIASQGAWERDARCILPVEGSEITPSDIFLTSTQPEKIICQNCGKENRYTAKFCESCGQEIIKIKCPSCGQVLLKKQNFCPYCGKEMLEIQPPL